MIAIIIYNIITYLNFKHNFKKGTKCNHLVSYHLTHFYLQDIYYKFIY